MLSRQHNFYQKFLQLLDAVLLGVAVWVAHALRYYVLNQITWFDAYPIEIQFASCYWMIAVAAATGPLTLEYMGLYVNDVSRPWFQIFWRIAWAQILVLVVLFTCVVVMRIPQPTISRAALGLFFILATTVISLRHVLFYFWLRQRGARSYLQQYMLLCGLPQARTHWKERFLSEPGKKFHVKAEFDLSQESLPRFVQVLHDEAVDIVVFSLDESILPQVREALLACEAEGVEAWVSADFIQPLFAGVQFDKFADQPLLIYRTVPAMSWELVAKRLLDIGAGTVLLVLTFPVMIAAAIAIRLESPGPIIFYQNRSGLHGRPFCMYKFRTMITNAEQARAELEDRNEMSGPVFKVKNDPRVTTVGAWLRRLSLDEFPQLWNVIRGEMSLVGPRPLPLYETANFGDISQRRRMSVRPGLTCLWQVRGRNKITNFKDWVQLDLEYIDRWSLWLDLQILLRTIPVVLFGWGAK